MGRYIYSLGGSINFYWRFPMNKDSNLGSILKELIPNNISIFVGETADIIMIAVCREEWSSISKILNDFIDNPENDINDRMMIRELRDSLERALEEDYFVDDYLLMEK